MHRIEVAFAADVVNAHRDAQIASRHGWTCSASDMIDGSLCLLNEQAAASGVSEIEVAAIARRYIYWDLKGQPQPRNFGSNVVLFNVGNHRGYLDPVSLRGSA